MDSEPPALQVNGQAIVKGTSLFHTETSEIYWVDRIGDERVVLDGLDGQLTKQLVEFRAAIRNEKIVVEARSPRHPE